MSKTGLKDALAEGTFVHLSHDFKLQSSDCAPTSCLSDSSVSYKLVGRALHSNSHWTSQFLINGRTFQYDDMSNKGRLRDIGDAAQILAEDRRTSLWVYCRTSENPVTFHYIALRRMLIHLFTSGLNGE